MAKCEESVKRGWKGLERWVVVHLSCLCAEV